MIGSDGRYYLSPLRRRMTYHVELVQSEPRPLAVVEAQATRATLHLTIPKCLEAVYAFLRTASVHQNGQNVVLYLDDESNLEVGVEVSGHFEDVEPVVWSSVPQGWAAKTTHTGRYEDLPMAHAAVRSWCARNGRPLAGPNWEVYGDWEDDRDKLVTVVYYLLQAPSRAVRKSHHDEDSSGQSSAA
jgi:effector-binding domain-containing protein